MKVPPSLYWPDTADSVILKMRDDIMPDPFVRRMRLVNLISAVVLRKIEPALLAPFDVEDLHHILDRQISQDAIIDQLDNEELADSLFYGDLTDLWGIAEAHPLLLKGFTSGWLQKFFLEPFDPLCVMLAMRTKLLLDVIDEMGHSYNLIRSIGYGWIDWGDIPDEIPGNPGDYYPPQIDNPIIVTPPAGGPAPGAPGYGTPGPGAPGYAPPGPGPGEPGYVPPVPPPSGPGAGYGPGGAGGPLGSMAAPSGLLDQGLWTGPIGSAGGMGASWNCALDKDDPTLYVHIGYEVLAMDVNSHQSLTVDQYHAGCPADLYTWDITQGQGELTMYEDYRAEYYAPAGGALCESPTIINLYCDGLLVDTIIVVINSCPFTAAIEPETLTMLVSSTQTLTAEAGEPGCGTPEYTWAIIAGGGALSAETGATVDYAAPETNTNCENSPIITLSCGGGLLATLELSINAVTTHTDYAWRDIVFDHCQHGGLGDGWEIAWGKMTYTYCDGTETTPIDAQGPVKTNPGGCDASWASLLLTLPPGDLRTPTQKAAGCCPAVAL